MEDKTSNNTRPATANLLRILSATSLYFIFFIIFYPITGDPIAAISFIPIVMVGWYYGSSHGVMASFLFFGINLLFKQIVTDVTFDDAIKSIFPFLIAVLLGYLSGILRLYIDKIKEQKKSLEIEISERNAAEKKLAENEFKVQELLNHLNEIILRLTYDKKINYVNIAWTQITGYLKDETIGKDFSEYISKKDRLEIDKLFSDLMLKKESISQRRVRLKTKHNEKHWFELSARLSSENVNLLEINCSMVDINDLVNTEETLTLKLEFDSLVNSISTTFISIPSGRIEMELGNAIQRIAFFLKSEMCFLYLKDENREELILKSYWIENKLIHKGNIPSTLYLDKLKVFKNTNELNRVYYFDGNEDTLKVENNESVFFLKDTKSGIAIPIVESEKIVGVFGFSYLTHPEMVAYELLQSLKSLGLIFVNALNRRRTDESILQFNKELELRVKEKTDDLEKLVNRLNSEISDKKVIEEKLEAKIFRLQMLKSLYEKFEVAIDMSSIFSNLYSTLNDYPKLSRVSLLLYDKTSNSLVSDGLLGFPRKTESFAYNSPQPVGSSISGKCFLEKKIVYIPDCNHTDIIPKFYVDYYKLKTTIAVPVLYSNSIKGVLRVDNINITNAFTEEDIEFFVMVSDILGIVIENANLFIEYNKMLKELVEGELRYKNLFDSNPHPILVYNTENLNFIMVNEAATYMYGYSEEEFKKLTLLDIHPDEEIYNYVRGEENSLDQLDERGIWRHKLKNGNYIFVEVVSHLIKYGEETAKMIIATNITERKIAEDNLTEYINELQKSKALIERNAKELAELNDKLSESEKSLRLLNANKDKFFSIISHDLRTPFNSILGFSEFLVTEIETLSTEEIKTYAGNIHRSSRNLVNLLNNVLEWSRVQTDRKKHLPEEFEIEDAIDDAISIVRGNAIFKEISIEKNIESGVTVYADRNSITSIVQNLLSNSIKFTFHGGHIKINMKRGKDYAKIEIEDNGIGLKEEELRKLFRIDVTHTTLGTNNEEGTGLGLILCKELIEKNGGKIWVESIPGIKTIFGISIPLKPMK